MPQQQGFTQLNGKNLHEASFADLRELAPLARQFATNPSIAGTDPQDKTTQDMVRMAGTFADAMDHLTQSQTMAIRPAAKPAPGMS